MSAACLGHPSQHLTLAVSRSLVSTRATVRRCALRRTLCIACYRVPPSLSTSSRAHLSPQRRATSEKYTMSVMNNESSDELFLRRLQPDDYNKGYLDLLAQLTAVGSVTEAEFQARVAEMRTRAPDYCVAVIEDTRTGKVVATGTLFVERKILRQCGLVGHIEDIVVDSGIRGKRLGQRIMEELVRVAEAAGCYKVILDCNDQNVPFYEKCGFRSKEVQMAKYF